MAVSGKQAAKTACQISGWSLSNLHLQKILYIAHMLHLGETNARLIRDKFEAWDYGPVLPSVYHCAKIFGSAPVRNVFRSISDLPQDSEEYARIEKTWKELRDISPAKLVSITHWEEGAWAKNYQPGKFGVEIPDGDIIREYQKLLDD